MSCGRLWRCAGRQASLMPASAFRSADEAQLAGQRPAGDDDEGRFTVRSFPRKREPSVFPGALRP